MKVNFDLRSCAYPTFNGNKKRETVVVLGSSRETDAILKSMELCSDVTRSLILANKNILTGCGTEGIMGAAYKTGKEYSIKNKNDRPAQNLVIVKKPLWGDEDLDNCVILECANSETERINKFHKKADDFLIFPGGVGTIQEAVVLIEKNYYSKPEERKKIILIGKDYFKGLQEQYQTMYEHGLLKCRPEELFTVLDSKEEILEKLS